MVLTVLQPGGVEMFCTGPVRSASRSCRHHIGRHTHHGAAMESPYRRRLTLSPSSEWKALRRLQQINRNKVIHELALLCPSFSCSDPPVEQKLDTIIDGFNRLLAFDQPWHQPPLQNSATTNCPVSGLIQWTAVNENVGEVHGQLQLPLELRNSHDLNVELDETARTLTVRVSDTRCASQFPSFDLSRSLVWEFSQRLDDAIELSQLEASFNPQENALQLRAPFKTVQDTVCSGSTKDNTFIETVEVRKARCEDQDATARLCDGRASQVSGDVGSDIQQTASVPICRRPVEIEDVGPDEESDKISISSDE